jgi:polyphenol oxidase
MSAVDRSQLLAATGRVLEGTSTVDLGNMSYLYGEPAEVDAARRRFLRQLGAKPTTCVSMWVTKQAEIRSVNVEQMAAQPHGQLTVKADALVTTSPGVGLLLPLADCQSVVLLDPARGVLALAHCGFTSANARLLPKLVAYLQTKHDCKPEDLLAYLGPSISAQNFTYDRNILSQTQGWGSYIAPAGPNLYTVDVRGFCHQQLVEAGITPQHLELSPIDTFASERHFSHAQLHRQGAAQQRLATYVELTA